TALMAAIMATAMPAAIRPYSMAVAPESSRKKRDMNSRILNSCVRWGSRVTALLMPHYRTGALRRIKEGRHKAVLILTNSGFGTATILDAVRREQFQPHALEDGFGAARGVKLAHQRFKMEFDGMPRNAEL